jgi:hypothetical protein
MDGACLAVMTGVVGGDEGVRKIRQLCANAAFFRRRLKEMGCHVLGDDDSPIVPMMLYSAPNICSFSRECLKRGLAVVVVGFPAVGTSPLILVPAVCLDSLAHYCVWCRRYHCCSDGRDSACRRRTHAKCSSTRWSKLRRLQS